MANRRAATRHPFKQEGSLSVGDVAPRHILTLDISAGGMGALVPFAVSVGATVYVHTDLPGPDGTGTFEAHCRVVNTMTLRNTDSHLVGLEFLGMRQPHQDALDRYLYMF